LKKESKKLSENCMRNYVVVLERSYHCAYASLIMKKVYMI